MLIAPLDLSKILHQRDKEQRGKPCYKVSPIKKKSFTPLNKSVVIQKSLEAFHLQPKATTSENKKIYVKPAVPVFRKPVTIVL